MKKKDNLIISWPGHCFLENILPILNSIKTKYNIYYITVDFDIKESLYIFLNDLKNQNILSDYFIVPKYKSTFSHFSSLNKYKYLKKLNFKVWLSMSHIELYQKFINDVLITNECKKIILWTQITYLFENRNLTEKLLNFNKSQKLSYENKLKKNFKKLKKIKNKKFNSLTVILLNYINGKYKRLRKKIIFYFLDYLSVILYFFYFKKILNFGKYDKLTQIGSGNADYILFTDKIEVEAHKSLFKNTKIDLVKHTGRDLCRCKLDNMKKNKILTPLSHPNNVDTIPDEELKMYLNAFKIAKQYTNFDEIHLRPHPREFGNWPNYLSNYLNLNNLNSIVVDSDYPIHDIICNYSGVIGESSCVLRDAANSCNFCFVVGIEKLSLHRYEYPRFVYGEGQNINWIDKDGRYNVKSFNNNKNIYYENTKAIYDFI